ncbi:hypothetical protein GCM10009543_22300 [Leifsonia naganoensis]
MSEGFVNPDGSEWVPAFPGQRPPFRPGNTLSVGNRGRRTHGASSPTVYLPLAKQIRADLLRVPELDYLADSSFTDLLFAFSVAEARERVFVEWMDGLSIEEAASDARGTPHLETARELMVRSSRLAARLGLAPDVPEDVREQIRDARTRVALKRERKAQKKAEADALVDAFRRARVVHRPTDQPDSAAGGWL